MHILQASQFTEKQIVGLFADADKMRSAPWNWKNALSGRLLGAFFFEPSTRTRLSFEAAMVRLGGDVLSESNANTNSSKAKGESLEDTIQTLSQYVDCIVMRHPEPMSVIDAAKYSDVPVINGGDGHNEHPTQALLDLYTIVREKGWLHNYNKLKVLFTGDLLCSRTAHSLIDMLLGYEVEIYLTSKIADNITNPKIHLIDEFMIRSVIADMDVVYMTRHQRERVMARKEPEFIMLPEVVEGMKKNAIIMHPLPRTAELPKSIDAFPQAIYLKKQVKNGMWVRMALLWSLLQTWQQG